MDAETWIWIILPLFAAIAGAIYQERRDRSEIRKLEASHAALDERVRVLELGDAHRQGTESVTDPETFDQKLLASLVAQQAINTQAIAGHGERLNTLEESEE